MRVRDGCNRARAAYLLLLCYLLRLSLHSILRPAAAVTRYSITGITCKLIYDYTVPGTSLH